MGKLSGRLNSLWRAPGVRGGGRKDRSNAVLQLKKYIGVGCATSQKVLCSLSFFARAQQKESMGTENSNIPSGRQSTSDKQKCGVRDRAANLELAKVIEQFEYLNLGV